MHVSIVVLHTDDLASMSALRALLSSVLPNLESPTDRTKKVQSRSCCGRQHHERIALAADAASGALCN